LKFIYTFGFFIISFLILPAGLVSQDTTSSVKNNTSKTHWSGLFKVEGSYQKGNTNKIFGMSKGEVKRTDGLLESILAAKLTYGESDGLKDENELSSSLTFDLFYDNIFSPFILQQTDFNYGREIDLRSQSGGGLKYTFINIPEIKASLSGAGIYDYTNLKERPGNADSRTWRFSARLKFKSSLFNGRINISHYTFYQPSFKDFKNTIWRSESELSAPLTGFLAVSSTYSYTHEAVVPAGVKQDDHQLTFGLEIIFK
jgi:hypothetical protein